MSRVGRNKARAIKYTQEEALRISTGKLRERLNLQKEYKGAFLSRMYKGAELEEVRRQITEEKITMQWYGQPYPKKILIWEHAIIQNQYFHLLAEETRLRETLLNQGLSEEKIMKILEDNTYFKEDSDFEVKKDVV